MTHRTIRRLSAALFLVLFIGVFWVALRSRETPAPVRTARIPVPTPEPVASALPPEPGPEIARPVKRVTPRPSPSPRNRETPPSKSAEELREREEVAKAAAAALEGLQEAAGHSAWMAAQPAVQQRMIGINPATLSAEEARDLGLAADQGAIRVQSVIPDSVASAVGLQAGDIITALDGLPLAAGNEVGSLRATMNQLTPGRIVALSIVRDGRPMTLHPTWDK